MKASELIGELIVLMVQHGDRQVVDLDGCDRITDAIWSEDSELELGADAPIYLRVDR